MQLRIPGSQHVHEAMQPGPVMHTALMRTTSAISLLLSALWIAGCSQPAAGAASKVTPQLHQAADSQDGQPHPANEVSAKAFPVSRVAPAVAQASSWAELIGTLPQDEAAYLRGVESRYFGAASFGSPEEKALLKNLDFPMPEDWLTARGMSDQELRELSDEGSGKASALYLDRLLDRAADYLPLREKDEGAYRASEGYRYSQEAYALANKVQASYASPFSSYLLGSMYSQLNYPPSPEIAVAGMFEAFDGGDPRASELVRRYQTSYPDLKLNEVLTARSATRTVR